MILDKSSVTFNLNNLSLSKLDLVISNSPPEPVFCKDLSKLVSRYKGFIDKIDHYKKWDNAKKISNPFELIYQGVTKSVSQLKPISRSYFKLLELIMDYKLISNKVHYRYAALAEGPGGFVECFIRYRQGKSFGKYDYIQCITLKSDSNEIPNWNKAGDLFKNNNVNISYGEDGTGNLYKAKNIIKFREQLNGNLVDLVTADGGFDYSIDFNQQEQLSVQLIFAETVCALNISKKGGNFVLKIFDIYTSLTVKILYILTLYYNSVIITKPHTSRPANSEKYVIAKGFKGIGEKQRLRFLEVLSEWDKTEKHQHVSDFIGFNMPEKFVASLYKLNLHYANLQLKNILKTIIFIEIDLEYKDIQYLKKTNIVYALEWCKKYKTAINSNSISIY